MGNNKACTIAGKGHIKIRMHDGVVWTLCDVIYIPELKKNLISLDTLHAKGFGDKNGKDCIRVSKGALIVMKGIRSARNIHKLIANTTICGAAVVKSDQDSQHREV